MARRPRLLVVAPNWLGDLVMATSLLELLRADAEAGRPEAEVHLAVRKRWATLMRGDPRVAALVPYDRGGVHAGVRGAWRLARDWRAEGFDAALVLPPSLRAAAVARLAGIPQRIGFRSDRRGFLLRPALEQPPRGAIHYTDELALLHRAWLRSRGLDLRRPLTAPVPSLPACAGLTAPPGFGDGPPLWALSVGATYGDAKSWPPERAAAFAAAAVAAHGVRVVLIGDPGARPLAESILAAADAPCHGEPGSEPGVYDLVGRTDLPALAGLLRAAAMFVGNDSGPMHLAAALGTPTVGIFGSSTPLWTGPRGRATTVVAVEDVPCHPCYLRTCPQPTFCLDGITPERVLAGARSLLPGGAGAGVRVWKPPGIDAPRPDAPTLFLDRDGVVIEDRHYLRDPLDVTLIPGAAPALRKAQEAGWRLIVVSNQSGIGRGVITEEEFAAVQQRVDVLLAEEDVHLDGFYYCPHAPGDDCHCRKPRPGMLQAASRHFAWDAADAWVIGDKVSDVLLGRQAGLGAVLVRTGEGRESARRLDPRWRVPVYADLARAVDHVLREAGT